MSFMTTQEGQSFGRTIRKIKVASTISKGDIPPDCLPKKKTEKNKLMVTPTVLTVSDQVTRDSKIKMGMMKKPITLKHSEENHDLLSSIKNKIHAAPGEPRNLISNDSFSEKHDCDEKTIKQKQEQKMESCCSSLDVEDSGLGEDASLSDNSDQTEVEKCKPINRPKVNCMSKFIGLLCYAVV